MTEYVDEIRLRKHVEALASDIGERNVSKPESLAAASSYIEAEWRTQGYEIARQVPTKASHDGYRSGSVKAERCGAGRGSTHAAPR